MTLHLKNELYPNKIDPILGGDRHTMSFQDVVLLNLEGGAPAHVISFYLNNIPVLSNIHISNRGIGNAKEIHTLLANRPCHCASP